MAVTTCLVAGEAKHELKHEGLTCIFKKCEKIFMLYLEFNTFRNPKLKKSIILTAENKQSSILK